MEFENEIEIEWNNHIDIGDHISSISCTTCDFSYSNLLNIHENIWTGRITKKTTSKK